MDAAIVTKGEFAHLSNVTPGRVSQWLSEGKIHGAAIVGEGQRARIRVDVAREQLRAGLDFGQRLGNGIDTRLDGPPAPPGPASSSPRASDGIEGRIKSERLRELEFRNRAAAEAEAARRGQFTATADVRQALNKTAADLVGAFESCLGDFATAIGARFQLPQRDVLHLLRAEFTTARAKMAQSARANAERLPGLLEADLSGEAIAEA